MQTTPKLGLKKPDLNDYVIVAELNENADILDTAVSELQDGTAVIPDLETTNKTLAGGINENKTNLATHLADDATLTKKGHVQLNSDIDSADETKAATPNAIKKVSEKLDNRLDESMPLRFTENGKTYRWGFRMLNGDPQFIFEEVIG